MTAENISVMRLAYKYELDVKPGQAHTLRLFCGHARFCFNQMLSMLIDEYDAFKKVLEELKAQGKSEEEILTYIKSNKPKIIKFDLTGEKLNKLKTKYPFLEECHSQILQQKVQDLFNAFKNFFEQPNNGYPKFKRKGLNDSIRYPQGYKLDETNSRIYLPKLGWVRYRKSRDIKGTIKNITVSLHHGKWYISIQTEFPLVPSISATDIKTAVGIDVGVARLATLSDGSFYEAIKDLVRAVSDKIGLLQQRLKHTIKGSSKNKSLKKRINKLYGYLANIRRNYLHQITTSIVKNHDIVVVEDLNLKAMTKSARGTIDNPGTNVKAKSGLNRSLLEEGLGEFVRLLEYKLKLKGGFLIKVDPRNTSRTCPHCGHIDKDNRKTQASFVCVKCGYKDNADKVGAINILRLGLSRLGSEPNQELGQL